jgi:hypothetical protein
MTEGDKLEQTPPSHGGDMSDLSSPIDVDGHRIDGLTLADAWMLASSTYGCAPTPLSRRFATTAIPARRRRTATASASTSPTTGHGVGRRRQRCRRLVPLRLRQGRGVRRAGRGLREARAAVCLPPSPRRRRSVSARGRTT